MGSDKGIPLEVHTKTERTGSRISEKKGFPDLLRTVHPLYHLETTYSNVFNATRDFFRKIIHKYFCIKCLHLSLIQKTREAILAETLMNIVFLPIHAGRPSFFSEFSGNPLRGEMRCSPAEGFIGIC